MRALPPVTEAAIAILLVVSMLRAYRGAPPQHPDGVAAASWLGAAVLLLATAVLAADEGARSLLAAAVVVCACVAGWWLRGGGDGDGEGDDSPPTDWDEFDRVRDGWSRPRVGV